MADRVPATAAICVLAKTFDIVSMSALVAIANWLPPLNPNQPSHKIKVPIVAAVIFDG